MKEMVIILLGFCISSCCKNRIESDKEVCETFFKEQFSLIDISHKRYSNAGYSDFDLSKFFERSNSLIKQDSMNSVIKLIKFNLDTIYQHYETVSPDLIQIVSALENHKVKDCAFYYNLTKTYQNFYSQLANVEGLYLVSHTVQLFLNNKTILERDTIYEFDYGIVRQGTPYDINMVYLHDEKITVSTYGRTGTFKERVEIKMYNEITGQEYSFSDDVEFEVQ